MSNTVYERYAEVSLSAEDELFTTPQYVTDCDGKQHDLSGNPLEKLRAVEKSMNYWGQEMKNSTNPEAVKFYDKFAHLYTQIALYIDSRKELVKGERL